ncbi:hypothetical protein NAU58_14925 [Pseudomonas stutzeri]|nr:hypothetical protein [Stutzerimonas stutzeri]MCQ4296872.1 hypothetical protein [Stutzerimonas stutzeri]
MLWYFSGLAITESAAPKWLEPASNFFTTLFGALAGAFFAFKFSDKIESRKRKAEEQERVGKEVATINRAILNLAIQYNTICNIKSELDKQKSIHHAAFSMPAFTNFHDGTRVDVGELALILTVSPQLLLDISIEQDGFIQAIKSLNVRNEFYVGILQPQMSKAGLLDRTCPLNEYSSKLSLGTFKTAYSSIENVISNVQSSHDGLKSKISSLRSESKSKYPQYKFMNIEHA